MAERTIKFIYNGQDLLIQGQKDELMQDIVKRYLTKIQKNQSDV